MVIKETVKGPKPLTIPVGYSAEYNHAIRLLELVSVRDCKSEWDYQRDGDPFYDVRRDEHLPTQSFVTWIGAEDLADISDALPAGAKPLQIIIHVTDKQTAVAETCEDLEIADYTAHLNGYDEDDEAINAARVEEIATSSNLLNVSGEDTTPEKTPRGERITEDLLDLDEDETLTDVLMKLSSNISYEHGDFVKGYYRGRRIISYYMLYRVSPTIWDYMNNFTEGDQELMDMYASGKILLPQQYLQDAMKKMTSSASQLKIAQQPAAACENE
jgi:hypothetical protein